MTHRVVRFLAVFTTAAAVVLAGIALNLGILSNRHWGPGGLTLGAAGVARTEATVTKRAAKPARAATTTRRVTATTPPTAPTDSSDVATPGSTRGARPFRPDTPTSGPGPTGTTLGLTPVTNDPVTTTPSKPRSTTTAPRLGDPQEFRVATWAKATAQFTTPTSLRVTAVVKRGWTVDKAVKTGRDVTMRFRNGSIEVTFHVWIKNGEIESTNQRVKHDS